MKHRCSKPNKIWVTVNIYLCWISIDERQCLGSSGLLLLAAAAELKQKDEEGKLFDCSEWKTFSFVSRWTPQTSHCLQLFLGFSFFSRDCLFSHVDLILWWILSPPLFYVSSDNQSDLQSNVELGSLQVLLTSLATNPTGNINKFVVYDGHHQVCSCTVPVNRSEMNSSKQWSPTTPGACIIQM